MKDGVIKNDGTSRLIKANLPATYEEMRAMAAAGTLPADILFNAAGWDILPDFLNKANLLTDETAALFSIGEDGKPNEALSVIGSRGFSGSHRYVEMITESGEWTVPDDIIGTELMVVAVGGAGAGGERSQGGGGAGGWVKAAFLNVNPGETFNCIIGAGGVRQYNAAGTSGGTTTFGNSARGTILTAEGGEGGCSAGANGGSGGGGGGYSNGGTSGGVGYQFGGGGGRVNGGNGGPYGGGGGAVSGTPGTGGTYGGNGGSSSVAAEDGTPLSSCFGIFFPFMFQSFGGKAGSSKIDSYGGGGFGGNGGSTVANGSGGGGGLGADGGNGSTATSDNSYQNGSGGGGGCGGRGGNGTGYGGGGGGGFFANGGGYGEDGQCPGAGGGGTYDLNAAGNGGDGAVIMFYRRRNVNAFPYL